MSFAAALAVDFSQEQDEVAGLIGDFVANVSGKLDAKVERAAKCALIDSLAVSMGALTHKSAQLARKHAYRFQAGQGCVIWGSGARAMPDTAALTNGVLLRCYDYNDFFVGKKNSGHPSDMMAALIAAAEWSGASGAELLTAIAVGYDATAAAFDAFSTAPGGWDYTNLTAIGAACAIARVLKLDAAQTREALAMTVIPHLASDEVESCELNRRGDLTMWKRFNGSDAARNALQACLLASVGVEGAVRPFTGNLGFIHKLANKSEDAIPVLREKFDARRPLSRVTETYMKRWPVGSQAQSAIQAALDARAKVKDIAAIKEVRVFSEEGSYEHFVTMRQDPYRPISRETADHSMPYVVGAAVLEGAITTDSFSPSRVLDPARRDFVANKVKAAPDLALGALKDGKHSRANAGYLSRVEIELNDGTVVHGEAKPFPGHPGAPFTDADLAAKLRENMEPFAGAAQTAALLALLDGIETLASVRDLTALLALSDTGVVDGAAAD